MEATNPVPPFSRRERGHIALLGLVATLAVLRLFAAVIQVPPFMAVGLSLVLSAIFIAVPVIGLFYSANHSWKWLPCFGLLLGGIALQAGFTALASSALFNPLVNLGLVILAQSGLLLWCFGLGALVALLIKDRNLLLPVALFLAGFDVFLVTFPLGPVQQVLQRQPEVFTKVAYSVPKVAESGQAVGVHIGSYVGPADFIFLSMFFVTLFKFKLRTRQTLPWMILALVGYLLVVLIFGSARLGPISLSALPALLPIGLVVLIVNFREFKMKTDEWIGTAIIGLIALGLAYAGVSAASRAQQARPVAPLPSPASQSDLGSEATPAPKPGD